MEETEEIKKLKANKITNLDLKKATIQQIEQQINELIEYNNTMDNFFDEQRKNMNIQLQNLYIVLGSKDYKTFMDLQSKALALRQTIVESISYYMQKLSKANSNYRKMYADRIDYYAVGHGLKLTDGTRTKMIDRDLSERNRNVELFQTHIEYLRECKNSCDQIGYAVKNLISLVSYMG